MVHGTAVVWLPVSDMQRSLAFYRDTLGLEEVRVEGEWAELDANGLHLGLNGTEPVHEGETGGGVVAFQPEGDLDEAVEGLRGQGVDFADGISDHPWGRIAPFRDPDGNDLQLYEAPSG